MVFGQQGRGVAHAADHGLEHALFRIEGRLLGHVADAGAGLAPHLAVVQAALAGQGLEQGGLAAAVAADQGHPFLRVQLEVGVVEQGHVAKGKAGGFELQVGHGRQPVEAKAAIVASPAAGQSPGLPGGAPPP